MSIETAIEETAIEETAIEGTAVVETAIDEPRAPESIEDASVAAVDHVLRIVNDSAVGVLLSIAFQAGLLDALRDLPPATSQQAADAAGLDERYVREILHGLLTAGIVVEDSGRYRLGDGYIPYLTGTGADNLARMARYLTLMGEATRKVVEKVASGGGLSYEEYPMFNAWQAEESAAVNDASLVEVIIPVAGVEERLVAGADVADVGCGAGHAVNLLARAYPRSRFTGFDFSEAAIDIGRAEAAAWGLSNARFEVLDIATWEADGEFDLVTAFDVIHDLARPAETLAAVHRALRSDGTFLMVDLKADSDPAQNASLPWAAFLYAFSTVHCMSVSLGQGGAGLGTAWGVQLAERMLREAGFGTVKIEDLEDDPFNAYYVARPMA
jgi:SAM-dependent methyltransferase